MSEVKKLLEKQAKWQKSRRALSWPEKIREAERMRADIARLRATRRGNGPREKRQAK